MNENTASLARKYFVGKTVAEMKAALDGCGASQIAVEHRGSVAVLHVTFPDNSILTMRRVRGSRRPPIVD